MSGDDSEEESTRGGRGGTGVVPKADSEEDYESKRKIKETSYVPTSIPLTREQDGPSVHFLDMLVTRDSGGAQVDVFDKRKEMPSLHACRRFPHIETL